MECSDRATSRSIYDGILKGLRANLIALRSEAVVGPNATATSDDPPTFVPLVTDPKMQSILTDRWKECVSCLGNNAPLAAVVMMGGLLEALLLTRINREVDPAPVYKALAAPKDKAGKTQPLKEWTLKSYIEVAHELKWITVAARDVGAVLRDYRNYIHPFKQLSHGVNLTPDDSRLLWEIAKEVSKQVVKGVHP
jgi:hypothetical protein